MGLDEFSVDSLVLFAVLNKVRFRGEAGDDFAQLVKISYLQHLKFLGHLKPNPNPRRGRPCLGGLDMECPRNAQGLQKEIDNRSRWDP